MTAWMITLPDAASEAGKHLSFLASVCLLNFQPYSNSLVHLLTCNDNAQFDPRRSRCEDPEAVDGTVQYLRRNEVMSGRRFTAKNQGFHYHVVACFAGLRPDWKDHLNDPLVQEVFGGFYGGLSLLGFSQTVFGESGGMPGNASPIVYMDDMPGDRRAQIVKEAYSKNGCSKTGTKVQAGIDTHSDGPSLVAKKFHRDLNIESTILCSPTVYVTRSNGMSAGGHKRNPSGRLAGLAVHAVNQDVDAELRSKFSRSS